MQSLFEETGVPAAARYYRWRDERSPLAIELRIELVPRILADLHIAEEMGMEGGGVLIGCFPKSMGPPTLRIEEFEAVGRRGGDGLPYVLLAEQRQRFTTVRKKVATRELSAVGYFRSNLRTGPFELSVSDRELMSAEFRHSIHVALLVAKDQSDGNPGKVRHLATYFVSVNGVIQNRVDPMTFPFDVDELQHLASAQPKPAAEVLAQPSAPSAETAVTLGRTEEPAPTAPLFRTLERRPERPATSGSGRSFAWRGVAFLGLVSLAFGLLGWNRKGSESSDASGRLALRVITEDSGIHGDQSIHVTWNHGYPQLQSATKGVLTVSELGTHKKITEFELGSSDLTAGSVKVDLARRPVEVTLVLWMPDSTFVTQVADAIS